MSEVLITREGPLGTLSLNRERQRNSLSGPAIVELLAGLKDAAADASVRAVILTGVGDKAFCAGGDLSSGMSDHGFLAQHEQRRQYAALLMALSGFEKPTLARVNGQALAGGLGLVVACDLAVAADDVQFGTPEVNVGLFPYMVTALLFRGDPPQARHGVGAGRWPHHCAAGRRVGADQIARCPAATRCPSEGTGVRRRREESGHFDWASGRCSRPVIATRNPRWNCWRDSSP